MHMIMEGKGTDHVLQHKDRNIFAGENFVKYWPDSHAHLDSINIKGQMTYLVITLQDSVISKRQIRKDIKAMNISYSAR